MAAPTTCAHAMIWQGLCADCGADVSLLQRERRDELVPIIGGGISHHGLVAHRKLAETLANDKTSLLLRQQRLVAVLDLDKTLIHTTNDQVAEMWIRDGVEGIHSFPLAGDGRRYFTKVRPGLKDFLDGLQDTYEMHVYTMGTRSYAQHILRIIDADRRYFSTRILTKDESFDIASKAINLEYLFPGGDNMVAIVDDLPPVWNNRPNLIPALPYEYFRTLDEVNAVPQQQQQQQHSAFGEKAMLGRVYESLPATSAIRVDERLKKLVAESWPDAGNLTAIAYYVVTAFRTLYEWRQEHAVAELQPTLQVWKLASAGMIEWMASISADVAYWLRQQDKAGGGAREQKSEEPAASAVSTPSSLAASLATSGAASDAVSGAASGAASATITTINPQESSPTEHHPVPATVSAASASGHPPRPEWRLQVLEEVEQADAMIALALQGFAVEVTRGDDSSLHFTATYTATAPTPITAVQRDLLLSYLTCLLDQRHTENMFSGSLGRWLADVLKDHGAQGAADALSARLSNSQLLDAALLLRVFRITCPDETRWPQTKSTVEILQEMIRALPDVHRVPFLKAPKDEDKALQTIGLVLRELHREFYARIADRGVADTREILPTLRSRFPFYYPWRLAGVNILFTGVIDRRLKIYKSPYYQLALSMGATVSEVMSADVTHVLMRAAGTDKQREAMRFPGTYLVNVDWLDACAAGMRAPEDHFAIDGLPLRVGEKTARATKRSHSASATTATTSPPPQTVADTDLGGKGQPMTETLRSEMEAELADALGEEGEEDEEEVENGIDEDGDGEDFFGDRADAVDGEGKAENGERADDDDAGPTSKRRKTSSGPATGAATAMRIRQSDDVSSEEDDDADDGDEVVDLFGDFVEEE